MNLKSNFPRLVCAITTFVMTIGMTFGMAVDGQNNVYADNPSDSTAQNHRSLNDTVIAVMQPRLLSDRQIDRLLKENRVVFIDGTPDPSQKQAVIDSIRREISIFYYDQFRQYNDPGAPYFLFLSRNANLTMGLGGVVRMRGYFDWGGAIPGSAFAPYLIPIPANPADTRQWGATPAGTCLYFRVLGNNRLLSRYELYIECNFNGYQQRGFHLKKAYASFRDFTIGLAPSTFSDGNAQVPMVDANGPANSITPTSILFRYMPTVKKHWVFAVSVETPNTSKQMGYDQYTAKVSNWTPDVAAFAQYQWAQGQHVRLSMLARCLSYRNLVEAKNHNVFGWGLQLSAVGSPLPQLTTYLTGNIGQGYGSLTADLTIGNYDLVCNPDRQGSMYAPRSFGWNVGIKYNFLPNLYSCATFGMSQYAPQHKVADSEYKSGMLAAVNLFWDPTPRVEFGIEYDWGRRANVDGTHRHAQRIGAVCQFAF